MKPFLRYLALFIFIHHFAFTEEEILEPKAQDFSSNHEQSNLSATPSSFVGMVNVINGDLVIREVDFVIPGPNPLPIEHYSTSYLNGTLGCVWNLNHFTKLKNEHQTLEIEPREEVPSKSLFTSTVYEGGSALESFQTHYAGIDVPTAYPSGHRGKTNCGSGLISGKTNPKNKILETIEHSNRDEFLLKEGSGTLHYFEGRAKKGFHNLLKTVYPNKNQLKLKYNKKKRVSHCSMKTSQGGTLGGYGIVYTEKEKTSQIALNLIGGHHVYYNLNKVYTKSEGQKYPLWLLNEVHRPNAPSIQYSYVPKKFYIAKKSFPDNRYTNIAYWWHGDHDGTRISSEDPRKGRVSGIAEPVDSDSSPVQTYRFHYQVNRDKSGITRVFDAYDNLTLYHYNRDLRLTCVEQYGKQNRAQREEKLYWGSGSNETNLVAQLVSSPQTGIEYLRTIQYDSKGNPTQETYSGNLTGQNKTPPELDQHNQAKHNGCEQYIKKSTFSTDGLNCKLSHEEGRQKTTYTYVSGKDQLSAKYIYDGDIIKKRHFYTYDLRGLLTSETIDDGSTKDKNDFTDVKLRTAHIISGRNEVPVCLVEDEYDHYWNENREEKNARHLHNIHNHLGHLQEQHHYDSENNLRYRLHWSYDQKGNIIEEVNALGQKTTRQFDDNKNLTYLQGPNQSYHYEYVYDFMNRLLREEKVDNQTGKKYAISHRYDRLHNRIATVDYLGNETNFEYDIFNRLTKTIYPDLPSPDGTMFRPEESIQYDIFGHPTLVIDRNGNQTQQKTTIRGKPYLITYPDGSQEKMEYNLDGTLKQRTERNGVITQLEYDYQLRPYSTTTISARGKPLSSTQIKYDAFNPIQEIDALGNVKNYEYDTQGRISAVTHGEAAEYYFYDTLGRKNKIKTCYGYEPEAYALKIFEYDLKDRVIEERLEDHAGNVLRKQNIVYDSDGNQIQTSTYSAAGTSTTNISYNIHAQPVEIIDPEGNTTHIEYVEDYCDAYGLAVPYTITTDPKGNVTIIISNTAGKVGMEQKKNALGVLLQEREYFYDGVGNLIQTKETVLSPEAPPRTVINEWVYNNMNQLIDCYEAVGEAEQKHTSHTYNQFGQKTEICKPDGQKIIHKYDGKGRLKKLKASNQSLSYTYTYDLNDNPIKIVDNIHQTTNLRSYNSNNQLIEETLGTGLKQTFGYDRQGRLRTVTLPDHSHIVYVYNAVDLIEVKRLNDSGAVAYNQSYEYDQAGNLSKSTLPFELGTIEKTYDLNHRPLSVKAPHFSETNAAYDSCNLLTAHHIEDPLGSLPCKYTYDDLSQLTSENTIRAHTYQFDSLNNRIAHDQKAIKVNALNQVLEDRKGTYAYDPNGNLLGKDGKQYTYDIWDRLETVSDATTRMTYRYDDQHRRIAKIRSRWNPRTNSWAELSSTNYLYVGRNEIGAYDKDENALELRILGHGKGGEIGAAIAIELSGKPYIPLFDFAGNTRVLLDTTGAAVETYRYTAFGEEEPIKNPLSPWRFSSKRVDPETGLVNFGRRYYNPSAGKWITTDPLGFQAGANLYAYVVNNPLTMIDLYGLEGRDFFDQRRDDRFYSKISERLAEIERIRIEEGTKRDYEIAKNLNVTIEQYFGPDKPCLFYTEGEPHPDDLMTLVLNGQDTDLRNSMVKANHVAKKSGYRVYGIYNPTQTPFLDLCRSGLLLIGFQTQCSRYLRQKLPEIIEGMKDGTNLHVLAHSQGVIEMNNALHSFEKSTRDRILVTGIAPGDYIQSDYCKDARHYRAALNRDIVPLVMLIKNFLFNINTKVLPSSPDANLFDHDFTSPTYVEVIKEHVLNYIESGGKRL